MRASAIAAAHFPAPTPVASLHSSWTYLSRLAGNGVCPPPAALETVCHSSYARCERKLWPERAAAAHSTGALEYAPRHSQSAAVRS